MSPNNFFAINTLTAQQMIENFFLQVRDNPNLSTEQKITIINSFVERLSDRTKQPWSNNKRNKL